MKSDIPEHRNSRNVYHRRAYLSIGNNSLRVTRIEYSSPKIKEGLDGFKIVHISDLHNQSFGSRQAGLISLVKEERPDIIVATGNSIDRRRTDIEAAMEFFRNAAKLCPVYFVTGNHEAMSRDYETFSNKLKDAGVIIFDNMHVVIEHNNTSLKLIGLPDPAFFCSSRCGERNARKAVRRALNDIMKDGSLNLNILLSHRPELIGIYAACGVDLVFSGHAHGGQVRLALLGGLYAPGQGVLPRYTSGLYYCGKTALVVSRGLGNSIFPLRIFNPPEIVSLIFRK